MENIPATVILYSVKGLLKIKSFHSPQESCYSKDVSESPDFHGADRNTFVV